MAEETQLRQMPASEVDLLFLTTEPEWGRGTVAPELMAKLKALEADTEPELWTDPDTGKKWLVPSKEDLWGLMSFYTRDMRLANLSHLGNEFRYCQENIDLASDCLREGYIMSFLTALSRAITVLELSQSRGGFLRRRQGTFTAENVQSTQEPQKKGLFGKKKKGD